MRASLADRLWAKTIRTDGCWLWAGVRTNLGYGQIYYAGRKEMAHRAAWFVTHGAIPDGLCVLHRCDTPACVRPDHLFLGTRADNTADMVAKGRVSRQYGNTWGRGRRLGCGKLTREAVERIRQRVLLDGASQASVAREFGLHQTTVSQIITGRRWSRL